MLCASEQSRSDGRIDAHVQIGAVEISIGIGVAGPPSGVDQHPCGGAVGLHGQGTTERNEKEKEECLHGN